MVCVSTHKGEDVVIIGHTLNLKNNKDLISVIIPRHINRVKEIESVYKEI